MDDETEITFTAPTGDEISEAELDDMLAKLGKVVA